MSSPMSIRSFHIAPALGQIVGLFVLGKFLVLYRLVSNMPGEGGGLKEEQHTRYRQYHLQTRAPMMPIAEPAIKRAPPFKYRGS